ncbi:fumarylacetoacetate hydrolase family protein [Sulfurimonas sp.]|uniref:fumarylacetoacetate hydrolase family protein n=1 Tax=Sulfurimonas sp. TaxID=2022749 RepID=UPI0025F3D70D|nr:fumarylacetoacetate hydrolase family protein [Sulfurimonas sp.]
MKTIKYNNQNVLTSKVVCVGRNYVEHIKELGNDTPENIVLFNKPNSAISDDLHYFSEDTRFEGEICFLIKGKKITGVGFGLDLTKANTQSYLKSKSLPWERAKAFDGSAVMSEFVDFDGDITKISFLLHINDVLTQEATYDLMIHKPLDIVNEIESFMSLEDNDIIMSGTPKGVNTYSVGDVFVGKVFCEGKLLLEQEWTVKAF